MFFKKKVNKVKDDTLIRLEEKLQRFGDDYSFRVGRYTFRVRSDEVVFSHPDVYKRDLTRATCEDLGFIADNIDDILDLAKASAEEKRVKKEKREDKIKEALSKIGESLD
jgi:predicted component of type VI protein secretion system